MKRNEKEKWKKILQAEAFEENESANDRK